MKKLGLLSVLFLLISGSLWAAVATNQILNFALTTEPPQLNSMKATDTSSSFVLGHILEGLTRYGKSDDIVPGVAEKWKNTDKDAIFYLRKNAKWSDGKPVTAHDFVFSWRMTLDPKTASEYAFFLYPIKNAEAINQGKLAGTELGAKAVDDYTLKIDFEKPCGYFLGITAFPTLYPVREDFYNQRKDRYAADASDLLSNGPFVLTKWLHGASLQLDKNQYYWDKNRIKVSRIDIPYITPDNNALFNLFKDKKIDMLTPIPKDDLPKAQREGFDMKSFADGSIFFMEFNFREGRAVVNKNLRKALQAVFDPKELVNKVIGIPGTKPGYYLIPTWLKGVKSSFRKEFPLVQNKKNIAEGKKYLALAMKELGLKTPPSLIWLTGDTVTTAKEAEYFQNLFKTTLGIDLKIDKQIFKQRLAKMTAGEFDIVAAGWGPDYADPMTFADLWTSWNENNRGKYSNPAYDKLIREAQATADPKKRMNAMAQAEKIGLDDLVVIPTYERTVVYLEHPWIKDVVRHSIGPDPDFTWVSVNK